MEYTAKYITPDIKLSYYDDKFFKSDIMFDHHMLIWLYPFHLSVNVGCIY